MESVHLLGRLDPNVLRFELDQYGLLVLDTAWGTIICVASDVTEEYLLVQKKMWHHHVVIVFKLSSCFGHAVIHEPPILLLAKKLPPHLWIFQPRLFVIRAYSNESAKTTITA